MPGVAPRPDTFRYQNLASERAVQIITQPGLPQQYEPYDNLWVHRIDQATAVPDVVNEAAVGIQAVLLAAYTRRFEGDQPMLPKDTFRTHLFDPANPGFVDRQAKKMYASMADPHKESQYFVTTTTPDLSASAVVALAKVSTSRPTSVKICKKLGLPANPNLFLDDIASIESRRGLGATTLMAVLEHAGFEPGRKIALHAFMRESQANQWFSDMGIHQGRVLAEPFTVGEHRLRQQLHVSTPGNSVSTALTYLKSRHPGIKYLGA